jgi:hypothetical protein
MCHFEFMVRMSIRQWYFFLVSICTPGGLWDRHRKCVGGGGGNMEDEEEKRVLT